MHYNDVIMTAMASQITSLTVVYSVVYSGGNQRNHQSCASLAFVWGIHRDLWIPAQRSSNAENVFIWWPHHGSPVESLRKGPVELWCLWIAWISCWTIVELSVICHHFVMACIRPCWRFISQVIYIYSAVWLQGGPFSPKSSQNASHSSTFRARDGVYFVSSNFGLYSASVATMRNAISHYIGPRYDGTRPYIHRNRKSYVQSCIRRLSACWRQIINTFILACKVIRTTMLSLDNA